MNHKIPFNKSTTAGHELERITEAILSGQIAGAQHFSRLCESKLTEIIGCEKALLTTSCTHALEMSALLLNVKEGDEVIVPSFTFVSTASAFALRGARLVFCDIRGDTLNMDESMLPHLITPKTRVIVPVHYAGVGCEMDDLMTIGDSSGVPIVEDNAHGLGGSFRGQPLGSFGCMATQSFHETKNITSGEGGALIINDSSLTERAEIVREKGTNRARFFRGQVDKYSWVDLGSSYVMSDVLSAFLLGQLEKFWEIQSARRSLWERYDEGLADWCLARGVGRPFVPSHCEQAWHMYYLRLPSLEARQRFIAHLRERGIAAVFHYLPLHASEFAKRWGCRLGQCPISEEVSDTIVRLPFYNSMTSSEQNVIIEAIREFNV
jgi:dTDP-4-amino-4,6-dideoxygalactose transaminase